MSTRSRSCLALVFGAALATGEARAQHSAHGSPGGAFHHPSGGAVTGPGFAVSGAGWSYGYGFPAYGGFGFGAIPFAYVQPLFVMVPVGVGPAGNPLGGGGMLAGPLPPPGFLDAGVPAAPLEGKPKPRKPDPSRAAQLVTLGDRNFRAGNLHRAAERYTQAISADPTAAAPRVRMAQVEVNRAQYVDAAQYYREALTVEPGWLVRAPDIQAIYSEPPDFARQIARLETHLQADPHDRDAWLVLGAQWYLSGQTRKAADVFLRLSDRQGDPTLAAFLDATTPRRPAPQ